MSYDGEFINSLMATVELVIGRLSPNEHKEVKTVLDRAYNRGVLDGSMETIHELHPRKGTGISDFALMEHIHGAGNANG